MVRSSKFQTLDHLLSTVGLRKVTVRVDSDLKAESSVDLSGYNLAFYFQRNGSLNVASGKVVSGLVLSNDPSWRIFTGSGSVRFGRGVVPALWWWPAVADGITDSTLGVQAAVNSAVLSRSGRLRAGSGEYEFGTVTLPNSSLAGSAGVIIEGEGCYSVSGTTPYGVATVFRSRSAEPLFQATDGTVGFTFRNLQFDGKNLGTHAFLGDGKEGMCNFEKVICTRFTDTALSITMGLNEVRDSYFTGNLNGVDMGSDGRFTGNHVISNTGYGVRLRGGTFFDNNESAYNGTYGVILDGATGNNSNHNWGTNYIEENGSAQVWIKGQSSSNKTVSKVQLGSLYLNTYSVDAYGIYAENVFGLQCNSLNYLGGADNVTSPRGKQVFYAKHVEEISICSVVSVHPNKNTLYFDTGVVGAIVNKVDIRDGIGVGASVDESYGVYVADGAYGVKVGQLLIQDGRGTPYSRGVRFPAADNFNTLIDYTRRGSATNPDVFGAVHYLIHDINYGMLRMSKFGFGQNGWSGISWGTGSPEGVVFGRPPAIYLRTDGVAGSLFYFKETGFDTTTGWVAKW